MNPFSEGSMYQAGCSALCVEYLVNPFSEGSMCLARCSALYVEYLMNPFSNPIDKEVEAEGRCDLARAVGAGMAGTAGPLSLSPCGLFQPGSFRAAQLLWASVCVSQDRASWQLYGLL